jgi:6-phosphogluconolactonase
MGRDVRLWRLLGIAVAALALTTPALASAAQLQQSGPKKVNYHAVYTTTNDPAGNSVVVFTRAANGTLTQRKVVSTGGKGIASTAPFGFPIVDSSGSVNLTPDGKLLFVVNAGDNSVSSFRITASGPKLVSHVSSHGKLPISLTSSGHLLYVVNETSQNIYGWRFSTTGKLTPVAGSNRKLTAVTPKGKKDKVGVTAGIGFAAKGGVVVVTQRGLPRHYGEIDTFLISRNGAAGPSHAFATPGIPNPFGFSSWGKQILVSNAGFVATPSGAEPNPADPAQFNGTAATYNVSPTGKLTLVKNTPTNGRAACWLVVTKNGRWAFVSNTLSDSVPDTFTGKGSVSVMSVSSSGKMTLHTQGSAGGPGFPSDEALSSNDHYLYVVDPFVMGAPSHIDVYKVGSNGSITHIQTTPSTLPNGVSGAAAF